MLPGNIHVVATGGTISSHYDGEQWTGLSGHELLGELGLSDQNISVEDVATGDSASLSPEDMLGITRHVEAAISAGAAGVVVTHGTDSLELTAYLMDLFLGPTLSVPVVITGSMRPHSHPEPDGPENLRHALQLVRDPACAERGVVVLLDDVIYSAAQVVKRDASRREAFTAVPGPALGSWGEAGATWNSPPPRSWQTPNGLVDAVPLVTIFSGMAPELLRGIATSAQGLVLEVFGDLNLPLPLWDVVYELSHLGLPIVFAGRPYAPGFRNEGLDFLGVVGSCGRTAPKARLALMAALGSLAAGEELYPRLESYLGGGA